MDVDALGEALLDHPAAGGVRDITFRMKELERRKLALRDVEVREFEDCGHFAAEEAPGRPVDAPRSFMERW